MLSTFHDTVGQRQYQWLRYMCMLLVKGSCIKDGSYDLVELTVCVIIADSQYILRPLVVARELSRLINPISAGLVGPLISAGGRIFSPLLEDLLKEI